MNLTDTPVEFSFLYDDDLIAVKEPAAKPKLIRQHSGPLPPIPVSSGSLLPMTPLSSASKDMSNGSTVMPSDSCMSKLSDEIGIHNVFPQNKIQSSTNGKFI
jgi:hypothetical protein